MKTAWTRTLFAVTLALSLLASVLPGTMTAAKASVYADWKGATLEAVNLACQPR